MTIPSPWIIGMIDTRTSISRPCTFILMRPSCGSRFSAMLSRAMILMRLMIAACEPVDLRRQVLVLEQAVDPVADADALLLVLDVDVASPLVGRLDQDLVHELDDRRFLRLLGHLAVVGLDAFEELDVVLVACLLGEGRDGVAADAEVLLDEPGDLARRGRAPA